MKTSKTNVYKLMFIFIQGPTQRDISVPKEKCSPRPMCRPPVSSGVYKMAKPILHEDSDIGSDGGGLEDLLSQVNNNSYLILQLLKVVQSNNI